MPASAPGGKGLLDARQPRATPTWTTRLDGRHMAFLKDHKVDTHIIFPAAGFVEMALEAGVQLFEGRPFAIEDFEIRSPLILPEPASGADHGAHLRARRAHVHHPEPVRAGRPSWSVHVVGSMRSERTESSFGNSVLEAPGADLEPEGVGAFYGHMSDLGLRYGDEFKPVRELAAGSGKSAGRVSLSENDRQPRRGIRAASGADGRCAARVLRRCQDRRRPQGEDETAGAFREDPVPALAGSLRPGPRQGAAFQRGTHRRPDRHLRRGRPPLRAGGWLPRHQHDRRPPRRGIRWQPRSGLSCRLGTHGSDRRSRAANFTCRSAQLRDVADDRPGRSHRPARPRRTRSRDGRRGRPRRRANRRADCGKWASAPRFPPTRSASPRRCARSSGA